jgi:glycosyltransferase involved in cell wall biosynthesis
LVTSGTIGDGADEPVAVSVVIAALDVRDHLVELLRSIAAVAGGVVEAVVVDGGSADGTVEWLRGGAPGLRGMRGVWRSAPDMGIADAWNSGIALASGEWVIFLGADDRIASGAAMTAVASRLRALPSSVRLAAAPVEVVSPAGKSIGTVAPQAGGRGEFPAVNSLPHQGVFHRRDAWDVHGPFDVNLHVASDYEFLVRAWVRGDRPVVIDDVAPPVRMAFGGASKKSPLANLREYRRVRRRHGVRQPVIQAVAEWCRAAARALLVAACGRRVVDRAADVIRRIRGLPPVWTVP